MNIFKILASNDGSINEPNVSSFLAYLLDPNENHGLGAKYLEAFLSPVIQANKDVFKDLLYKDRVRDLSTKSQFEIRVRAEETVKLEYEGKRKVRDIDILIELYNTSQTGRHIKVPQYAFAVENKIRDEAIVKGDDQLFQEIIGLRNRYLGTNDTENTVQPIIALIFLTPRATKRASEEIQQVLVKLQHYLPATTIPCQQVTWGTTEEDSNDTVSAQLAKILEWEATGRIEPVYEYTKHTIKSFLTFIMSDFQSYQEEKNESFERKDYGKPVIQYFNDVYNTLDFNKDITVEELKTAVRDRVYQASSQEIDRGTLNAHVIMTIVNNKTRKNHVRNPYKHERNLFYYPIENNKKNIRKLDRDNPLGGLNIYWWDEAENKLGQCLLTEIYPVKSLD